MFRQVGYTLENFKKNILQRKCLKKLLKKGYKEAKKRIMKSLRRKKSLKSIFKEDARVKTFGSKNSCALLWGTIGDKLESFCSGRRKTVISV